MFGDVLFLYIDDQLFSIPNPGNDSEENQIKILDTVETHLLFQNPEKYSLENVLIDEQDRIFINEKLHTKDYEIFYEYLSKN